MKTTTQPATLIALNSPLYLKRMARELSHRDGGFYWCGERWNRAHVDGYNSITGGMPVTLVIERTTFRDENGKTMGTETHHFADLTNVVFGDGNGGTICASRHQARAALATPAQLERHCCQRMLIGGTPRECLAEMHRYLATAAVNAALNPVGA